jgi:hypothetical protein
MYVFLPALQLARLSVIVRVLHTAIAQCSATLGTEPYINWIMH